MRRILISALMTVAMASSAGAQYGGFPRVTEPAYWLSGGVGAFNGQGVHDGTTKSTWDFGQKTSWQYRATLEKAIQNESTIGLVGTFVRVPITYTGPGNIVFAPCPSTGCTGTPSTGGCSGCAAHLDMMGLAAQFHAGGGTGLHQVIEIAIGATSYRNLRKDSDGAALIPANNLDGNFSLGYGFGYGFSSNSEITLTQDYGMVLHEGKDLPSGTSNTNTVRSIRAALRYGFGARRPGIRRR